MLGQLNVAPAFLRLLRSRRLWLLLLLTPAVVAAQQVYKWTDAAGTVHYSEHRPVGAATVMKLSGDEHPATPEQAVEEASRALADGQAELAQVDRRQRQRMCAKARGNLKLLDSDAMVLGHGDMKTATRLSDEQRSAARSEAKQQMGMYCDE